MLLHVQDTVQRSSRFCSDPPNGSAPATSVVQMEGMESTCICVGNPGVGQSTLVGALIGSSARKLRDSAEEPHDTCRGDLFLIDVDVYFGGVCISSFQISWQKIVTMCRYFMECKDWRRACAFRVRPERHFIPRWPYGRELEVEDAPGVHRLQDELDEINGFLSRSQKQEKMAEMLQHLEAGCDPDCILLYHYTPTESAKSILKQGFVTSHCQTNVSGIYLTRLSPADADWAAVQWEEGMLLKVFGRGCGQVAAWSDFAVVIVELPKMMLLQCGENTWFCPQPKDICCYDHRLQRHIKGVATLTRWVSLRWCLTGERFHAITEHVACDRPDFVDWLRNHLHEKFGLSYYTTKLMVDFPGSEGPGMQRACLTSGTWAELQRPSQIYVYQAVPHDFPEYRDLLHSSETSKLESALFAGQDPNSTNERGQTAAWRASRNGDLEKLRCLHKANADFDKTDNRGASPLFAASDKGNVVVVRFLLDCGAHVNLQGGPGDGTNAVVAFASPLYADCQNCNEEIVQILLDARANVNERTADGATALMVAAQNGHEKVCSRVLAACETTINLEDPTGLTALYFAAQNGHAEIVGMLLKTGASTEVRSHDGATPLFKAAQNGHQQAVAVLLQHRADVFAAARDGTTPLILAAHNGHVDVVDVLVPEIINRAGVQGLDIGMQSSGATATFVAAQAGKDRVVRRLAFFGADVQKSLASGACPIHIAAQLGHLTVLKELLDAKADVEARGPDGVTALYLASKNDHLESAEHLLEQGADPDACLDSGHQQP
ncbi:Ank1 [Symbiodinium necroappetens]|uniref:Ank1 protein n=1 Tax=Symbiodinium necroappetens TaxID=1628268 RepID=A0A813BZ91_9DINO|nr:Ank1 [Symbiodinium necroappetens]